MLVWMHGCLMYIGSYSFISTSFQISLDNSESSLIWRWKVDLILDMNRKLEFLGCSIFFTTERSDLLSSHFLFPHNILDILLFFFSWLYRTSYKSVPSRNRYTSLLENNIYICHFYEESEVQDKELCLGNLKCLEIWPEISVVINIFSMNPITIKDFKPLPWVSKHASFF